MTTKHLHVFAITRTGGCLLTVRRTCIFAGQTPEIAQWDHWIWDEEEPAAAIAIGKPEHIQVMDYKIGPAIISEDSDESSDLNAMLILLHYEKRTGDSTLHFSQPEAADTIDDDVLKRQGMYGEHAGIKAAVKHALAILREAREDREFALELWPYPPDGIGLSARQTLPKCYNRPVNRLT